MLRIVMRLSGVLTAGFTGVERRAMVLRHESQGIVPSEARVERSTGSRQGTAHELSRPLEPMDVAALDAHEAIGRRPEPLEAEHR